VGWHSKKKSFVLSVMKRSVSMACGKRGREVAVKEDTSAKQVKPVKCVAVGRGGVWSTIHYIVSTGEKDYFLRVNLLLGNMYEMCKTEEELQDHVLDHGETEWKQYVYGELWEEMVKTDKGFTSLCFEKAELFNAEDTAEDVEYNVQVRVPFVMRLEGKVDENVDGKNGGGGARMGVLEPRAGGLSARYGFVALWRLFEFGAEGLRDGCGYLWWNSGAGGLGDGVYVLSLPGDTHRCGASI
jgi:hypothetical protein